MNNLRSFSLNFGERVKKNPASFWKKRWLLYKNVVLVMLITFFRCYFFFKLNTKKNKKMYGYFCNKLTYNFIVIQLTTHYPNGKGVNALSCRFLNDLNWTYLALLVCLISCLFVCLFLIVMFCSLHIHWYLLLIFNSWWSYLIKSLWRM